MVFTAEHITTLKAAIATGAVEVWYGDKKVKYRSLAEMKETLAMVEAEVNPPAIPLPRRRYAIHSRGLI